MKCAILNKELRGAMPKGVQASADPIDRWLGKHPEVITYRTVTQSRVISLDSKQLQDLGSSSCSFYQRIRTFFREKNPAQWYQARAEQLVEKHNTDVIAAVLKQPPYQCSETRIGEVTSFLHDHHSIPLNRILENGAMADPLVGKLNLILEFKDQLDKPWIKGTLTDAKVDEMLLDDSPQGTEHMKLIVEVGRKIEESKIDPKQAVNIMSQIAMPVEFSLDSVIVIKQLIDLCGRMHVKESAPTLEIAKRLHADPETRGMTSSFLHDIGQNNGLRQMMGQLKPELIQNPEFPNAVRELMGSWGPLLDLPDERFATWVQNRASNIQTLDDLKGLPGAFREEQVVRLREVGAHRMADGLKQVLDFKDIDEVPWILGSAKEKLELVGAGHVYNQMVASEGTPREVAESISRTAQEYKEVADRYQKMGEGDKFRSVVSDPKNANEPLKDLQNKFNSRQWEEAKKEFPKPIHDKVEAAVNGTHFKEVPAVQLYYAATKQGGLLDRFKQFLGADELTKVIKGAVIEDSAASEAALTELVELRAIYQRYNLDTQFLQSINTYLERKEVKALPDSQKIAGFLAERAHIQTELRGLDMMRAKHFTPIGLDTLFDEFTAILIAEKMKVPGATFPNVLKEIRAQYQTPPYVARTLDEGMAGIINYQEQLVARLVPPDAPETARTEMRGIVQKNTETALRSMLGRTSLETALWLVKVGLEVSAQSGQLDIDAINAVKNLRGPYYAGQYQRYEAEGIINADKYNAADEEVQLHMMAGAYAQDINTQLGYTLLTPQFVAEYIQRPVHPDVPDPVSFQMMRLMEAARPFFSDRQNEKPVIPPELCTPENFQAFLADWETIVFPLDSNRPLMPLNRAFYVAYQTANQDGRISTLMSQLGSSPKVLEALRAEGEVGSKNRAALINIGTYYLDYTQKSSYSIEQIARGFRSILDQGDLRKTADNLGGVAKIYRVSEHGFNNTEQRLHLAVFRSWAEDQAAPGTHAKAGGEQLLNTLIGAFKGTNDRIPSKQELDYASHLIGFATKQLQQGADPEKIAVALFRTFSANLKGLAIPADIDKKFEGISRVLQKRTVDHNKIAQSLQQRPLRVGTVMLPVLVEELLPPSDRGRVKDLKKQLAKLEETANDIVAVKALGGILGTGYTLAADVLTRTDADVATTIKETRTDLQEIALNNAKGLPQVGDKSAVSKAAAAIIDKVIDGVVDSAKAVQPNSALRELRAPLEQKASDITAQLANPDITPQEKQRLEKELLDTNKMLETKVSFGPLGELMITILPLVVRHGQKLAKGAGLLPSLVSGLGIARKGMVWAAQPIVNKLLERLVPQMSAEERQVIVAGIGPVLEILFLAGPTILKNHDGKVYLEYLNNLNVKIQSGEPIDADQLRRDTWALVGQFLQEAETYTSAIEAAVLAAPDLYE